MKKFIKLAFVAAIAAVSGYNVYQSQSVMDNMSEFALANVEALAADDEVGGFINCCNNCKGDFCGTFFPAADPTQKITMYYSIN